MSTLLLAFAAGLLTILSPCVLPLAPIVVAGARAQGFGGPLMLAAGLALTFGVVGGVLATLGIAADAPGIRIASAIVMVCFGLAMLLPILSHRVEFALAPLSRWASAFGGRVPAVGLFGQFAAGAVLALAWAPCVGPTLGAAFALAASGRSLPGAIATMAIFAMGAAFSLLIAGCGMGFVAARAVAARAVRFWQGALGTAFVVVGAIILTGVDRAAEALFVRAMPDWLVTFATRI